MRAASSHKARPLHAPLAPRAVRGANDPVASIFRHVRHPHTNFPARPGLLCLALGFLLAGAGAHAAVANQNPAAALAIQPSAASPQNLGLDDLWEDTPATSGLAYSFRIYKHKELSNHLHRQLRLYLMYPAATGPREPRPAIVFIHGGGWGAGDADQWFPQARYFALRGMVGVSVDYRLKSDRSSVADCVTDCKSAIRYLRRNAAALGIAPNQIVVVGESAGGHLAAALGTLEGFEEPGEDRTISSVPNLLILLNPITDLSTRWGEGLGSQTQALSPLQHVSKQTPPVLLIHGDADSVVELRHSRDFHEKMLSLGNQSRLLVLPGAGHAFAIFKYGPDRFVRRAILEVDQWLVSRGWLEGAPALRSTLDSE